MYSPRSRWRRSARPAALLRITSRSLRQATYSGEPTATLLVRQIASSSSPRLETGIWLRCAQAERTNARSDRAMQSFAELSCIQNPVLSGGVLAGLDPAIHRKEGHFLKAMDARVKPG